MHPHGTTFACPDPIISTDSATESHFGQLNAITYTMFSQSINIVSGQIGSFNHPILCVKFVVGGAGNTVYRHYFLYALVPLFRHRFGFYFTRIANRQNHITDFNIYHLLSATVSHGHFTFTGNTFIVDCDFMV
jgi:hypothetical protein